MQKKKRLYCQQVRKGILSWWFRDSELFFLLRKWNETISWEKCPYSFRRNSWRPLRVRVRYIHTHNETSSSNNRGWKLNLPGRKISGRRDCGRERVYKMFRDGILSSLWEVCACYANSSSLPRRYVSITSVSFSNAFVPGDSLEEFE